MLIHAHISIFITFDKKRRPFDQTTHWFVFSLIQENAIKFYEDHKSQHDLPAGPGVWIQLINKLQRNSIQDLISI